MNDFETVEAILVLAAIEHETIIHPGGVYQGIHLPQLGWRIGFGHWELVSAEAQYQALCDFLAEDMGQ